MLYLFIYSGLLGVLMSIFDKFISITLEISKNRENMLTVSILMVDF